MGNEIAIVIKATDKASAQLQKVKGASDSFKKSMVSLGVAVGVVTGAVVAAQQAWKQLVDPLIKYNKTILDSSRATGMTTEELSRLAEVAGDMGVELSAVEKALKMMTKRGMDPSIEAIAKLADKANALSSASERAAFLSKVFGRSWSTLDPLLQQGGDAIRQMTAEIESGIVVTEEEIKKTERARLAIEQISDAYISLRNNVALFIVDGIEREVDASIRATEITDRRTAAQIRLRTLGIEPNIASIAAMAGVMERENRLLELGAQKGEELGVSAWNAADAIEDLSQSEVLNAAAQAIMAGDTALAQSLMDTWTAADTLEKKMQSIADRLAGGLSVETVAMQEMMAGMAGTGVPRQWAQPAMEAMPAVVGPSTIPAPDMTSYQAAWRTALQDIEATKFPNLEKSMVAGVERPVRDAFRVLNSMDQRTIITRWDKYETTYKRTVRLDGGLPYGAQHGADFVVPPGYPNDSYPLRVTSGEHVIVQPANTDNSRNVNINGPVSFNSEQDRAKFDRQMRTWLGA